uniref:Uncharacterized protein n=1 Tax=Vitis vinifera TaxID=29760 RepID=F6HTA2_VITVI
MLQMGLSRSVQEGGGSQEFLSLPLHPL